MGQDPQHASTWLVSANGQRPHQICEGEAIVLPAGVYRLVTATAGLEHHFSNARAPLRSLTHAHLSIHVASDHESAYIEIEDSFARSTSALRSALYLLAFLADQRLSQSRLQPNCEASELGWTTTAHVLADLNYSAREHLSVDVYRCRQELKRLGFADADRIIERRRRQMRIGLTAARLDLRLRNHANETPNTNRWPIP